MTIEGLLLNRGPYIVPNFGSSSNRRFVRSPVETGVLVLHVVMESGGRRVETEMIKRNKGRNYLRFSIEENV